MDTRERTILASAGVVGIFVLVQLGALALVEPFHQEGHQVAEDTGDPSLSLFFILAILVVTAVMLAALKRGGQNVMRLLIIFAGAYIAFFVFDVLAPDLLVVSIGEMPIDVIAVLAALGLGGLLYAYPEWYVIDGAGIIMGIGAAGLFGVNLEIFPVLVLLVGLAIYDAISVYGTEHMLTLASGVMKMRVPVVLVVPLTLSYTFLDEDLPDPVRDDESEESEGEPVETTGESGREESEGTNEDGEDPLTAAYLEELGPEGIAELEPHRLQEIDPEEFQELDDELREVVSEQLPSRDALFIGLGDAVIPTVLVASAAFFVDAPAIELGIMSPNVPALTAMGGTMLGLVALLWLVSKGRAHAGLPLLNGGAIAGYLLGALASGLTLVEALGLSAFF